MAQTTFDERLKTIIQSLPLRTEWSKETLLLMESVGDNPDDFPFDLNGRINDAIGEIKSAFVDIIPKEKNKEKYTSDPDIHLLIAEANYNQAIKEITEKIK